MEKLTEIKITKILNFLIEINYTFRFFQAWHWCLEQFWVECPQWLVIMTQKDQYFHINTKLFFLKWLVIENKSILSELQTQNVSLWT